MESTNQKRKEWLDSVQEPFLKDRFYNKFSKGTLIAIIIVTLLVVIF